MRSAWRISRLSAEIVKPETADRDRPARRRAVIRLEEWRPGRDNR